MSTNKSKELEKWALPRTTKYNLFQIHCSGQIREGILSVPEGVTQEKYVSSLWTSLPKIDKSAFENTSNLIRDSSSFVEDRHLRLMVLGALVKKMEEYALTLVYSH
jgi:hypothetical protein